MLQEDHSWFLQVVRRALCSVTFLKGKYFNAQKKETAGKNGREKFRKTRKVTRRLRWRHTFSIFIEYFQNIVVYP